MAYTLGFGKHAERTLEWLFFNDPGYVWWMIKDHVHTQRLHGAALSRFNDLVRRARHLRVPGTCIWCRKGRAISRMFLTQHISGGLAKVDFDCDTCYPMGGSPTAGTVPSFFTPDFYRGYDKTGATFMIRAIKYAYFKDESYRMTQKRLEEFFDNPDNFVNF